MIDAPVNVISPRVRARVTFEALSMGIKNDLGLETCAAGLQNVSAGSATTELALPKLLKGDFGVSFTWALMYDWLGIDARHRWY